MNRHRLSPIPPMLAGLVGAVAFETSAGLLLYADEGFLPALTLILTTEVGALGLGLWSGSVSLGTGVVEQIRRRWHFSLIVFALAAVLASVLSFSGDLPNTGLGQGLGLGFLGGLPLFSIGSLLGAMGRLDDSRRSPLPSVGAPAAMGAAAGFLLAGVVLLPNAAPYTLYLSCIMILSGGALLEGWVLDGRPSVEVLESVPASTGKLRMEVRAVGNPRRELKVLLEGGRLRGAEDPDGNPGREWEVAILEGVGREGRRPDSLLYVGGGSGTFLRLLSRRSSDTRIHVVERGAELVSLAQAHFQSWDGWGEVSVEIGDPLSPPQESRRTFSMIVVDCGILPTFGGMPSLGEVGWHFLSGALEPGGVVFMGGFQPQEGGVGPSLLEFFREGRRWFEGASLYLRERVTPGPQLLVEMGADREILLLFSTPGATEWPLSLSTFQFRPPEEA